MPEPGTTYWKSLDELRADSRALARRRREFLEALPRGERPAGPPPPRGRREFLAGMGFGLGALGLAACARAPVQKAVPPFEPAAELVPGLPAWYASTCGACPASCSLLVKTRDGRPIKIEGNPQSSLFGPGTCAVGQAAVLSLYDGERLRGPRWRGRPASWDDVDGHVTAALRAAPGAGVELLTGTVVSPSTRELIGLWLAHHPGARHVEYDAASWSATRAAARRSFGRALVPHFRFDRARALVALEADFLGSWLSPVEFARQYARRRQPGGTEPLSRHVQFESGLSLTGANADLRVPVRPSEHAVVALALLQRVAGRAGGGAEPPPGPAALPCEPALLDRVAGELWSARGESLVVCGVQDVALQLAVNALNGLLGNVGHTLDVQRPSLQKQGDDEALDALLARMERGDVHVLLLHGVNPVYDHPQAGRFARALERVALSVSFADRLDETATRAQAVCPDHHFLETWSDAEPVTGHLSLTQPTLAPLFDTRAAQDSLLRWMGRPQDYHAFLRDHWRRRVHARLEPGVPFEEFWDRALHDGVRELPAAGLASPLPPQDWRAAAEALGEQVARTQAGARGGELHLYESVALRDGRHANNPWLQELPDPVSKLTWGNAAAVAPADAARLGVEDGDVLALVAGGRRLELPAFVQPGQAAGTVSVALGYGRESAGKVARGVGANAFGLVDSRDGHRRYAAAGVQLEKTGRRVSLAATQTHHSMEGRDIVRELRPGQVERPHEGATHERRPTLYGEPARGEQAWGLAVDLSACTGCSACVIACQAENNVPVVGPEEVARGREMHWIRVDRYYAGDAERPRTVFQPMMCQHCGHAPCEPVCPVLATVHSSDGLNQQVYNRCIGTRYCANNCPYKVRRFNWFEYANSARFDYHMNDPLGALALNPDVVVRSRGVMEKCSLCVQRIQAARAAARRAGRPVADGEIQTACQQACPTQAIVFGDLRDPRSAVARRRRDPRHYEVLGELGTRPSVGYLAKVRNPLEGA